MSAGSGIRRELLSDLAISLASGILLAVGGSAIAALTPVHADISVPTWLFVAIAATSFPAVFLLTRRLTRPGPQVFIMISAFAQTRWLAGLLDSAARSFDHHGMDLIVKLPQHDYSGQSQARELKAIRKKKRALVGGVIVCSHPQAIRRELADFSTTTGLPIVFVDIRPFHQVEDCPPRTVFVGCDADEIGERAAQWVAQELREAGKDRPAILVVAGEAQDGRHRAFAAKTHDMTPLSKLHINTQGNFSRESAREIVDQHLRHLHRRGESLDAIYCTNDEMALGAVDAVKEHEARGNQHAGLFILGVDGTPDALATIKSGATPFRATIIQDPRRIADAAVDLLLRMRAGESVPTQTLVTSTVYPSSSS
ncbi:sugar ABC transporter substrate-binding protein [Streptomyces sp. NPDC004610]|uniref:sugar ABC transporter substrate-binding protein n=1 Tax=unclassified Streptomyces TaxID=2593676 RepID=UPI0033B2CFB1